MKKNPTYKEQFDKLTRAYINGEVDMMDECACFVGNILNNKGDWRKVRCWVSGSGFKLSEWLTIEFKSTDYCYKESIDCIKKEAAGFYTLNQLYYLEDVFMSAYNDNLFTNDSHEERLFYSFEKGLETLKQIHISNGEIIDEVPVFKKRELQTI